MPTENHTDFGQFPSLVFPPRHALARMLARIKTRKIPINIDNVTVARMFYPQKGISTLSPSLTFHMKLIIDFGLPILARPLFEPFANSCGKLSVFNLCLEGRYTPPTTRLALTSMRFALRPALSVASAVTSADIKPKIGKETVNKW